MEMRETRISEAEPESRPRRSGGDRVRPWSSSTRRGQPPHVQKETAASSGLRRKQGEEAELVFAQGPLPGPHARIAVVRIDIRACTLRWSRKSGRFDTKVWSHTGGKRLAYSRGESAPATEDRGAATDTWTLATRCEDILQTWDGKTHLPPSPAATHHCFPAPPQPVQGPHRQETVELQPGLTNNAAKANKGGTLPQSITQGAEREKAGLGAVWPMGSGRCSATLTLASCWHPFLPPLAALSSVRPPWRSAQGLLIMSC
ncbi:uncharacterized protein B0H18DRAFT_86828 [Fomitopsis serialis]|uniref:uncharacterized protein n=1 Tax=Fomitopsis serialis TaxID=139415 RepID=UPI002007CE59|nr:uncharacterized protein B0H18DRAFT_86828 [Neoantrodia serialis]KAH9931529.1 hypothetical protein B0H18DRAFT_86828 [Neoantrodia serialis]